MMPLDLDEVWYLIDRIPDMDDSCRWALLEEVLQSLAVPEDLARQVMATRGAPVANLARLRQWRLWAEGEGA